jgi:hypothetical protein
VGPDLRRLDRRPRSASWPRGAHELHQPSAAARHSGALALSRERSCRRGGAETAASPLEQTPGRRPSHRSVGQAAVVRNRAVSASGLSPHRPQDRGFSFRRRWGWSRSRAAAATGWRTACCFVKPEVNGGPPEVPDLLKSRHAAAVSVGFRFDCSADRRIVKIAQAPASGSRSSVIGPCRRPVGRPPWFRCEPGLRLDPLAVSPVRPVAKVPLRHSSGSVTHSHVCQPCF